MRRLTVFNNISLDGRFVDAGGDMSWAHHAPDDTEWHEFVAGNAGGGGALAFGRVTYEMMASWWPSPAAAQAMPDVASAMNALPKYVFSRTLERASWQNTTLLKGDAVAAMRDLKATAGPDLTILGSGSIVAQLAAAGLVDAWQLVVAPLALGGGRTLFDGMPGHLALTLAGTRAFRNGCVLLSYRA